MKYRLISDENLEALDLEVDSYKELIWYVSQEKIEEIYSEGSTENISKEELEEFTEYFKAFIKVTPEEVNALEKVFVSIVKKAKNMYVNK